MYIYDDICNKIERLTMTLGLKKILFKFKPTQIQLYQIRLLVKEINYLEYKLQHLEHSFVFKRRKSIA